MSWTVYVAHLERPLGNLLNMRGQASHYLGITNDLDQRAHDHRVGRGARLLWAATQQGIPWALNPLVTDLSHGQARTLEWCAKQKIKAHNRLCPICGPLHKWGRVWLPVHLVQAAPGEDFDRIPTPEAREDRRFEWLVRRAWGNARPVTTTDLYDDPDSIIPW